MHCCKNNPCLGKKIHVELMKSVARSGCLNDKHCCFMHIFTESVNQIKVATCMIQGINYM